MQHTQARQPVRGGVEEEDKRNMIAQRIEKIDGEEFVVTEGSNKCELYVTNGNDTGRVTWHEATRRYRGAFEGWGSDAETVEDAVRTAARRIMQARKGVSREQACEGMDTYLKS